mgnify:CR=1 FL=1
MIKNIFTMMCTVGLLAFSGEACADLPKAFLSTYCIDCHGFETQKSDRRFDGLNEAITDLKQLELWQEIVDQLNLGNMPPPKEKQPGGLEKARIIALITAEIAAARAERDAERAPALHRHVERAIRATRIAVHVGERERHGAARVAQGNAHALVPLLRVAVDLAELEAHVERAAGGPAHPWRDLVEGQREVRRDHRAAAETADAAVAAELGDETRLRADAVRDVAGECVRGETHGVGVYRGERCVRMRVDGSVVCG